MPVEEWDISCRGCHVRTDKRGVQIIYETGSTEIDYTEIEDVELDVVPRSNVIGTSAYVWGIVATTAIVAGLVMLSLVEYRQPFVTGYILTVAGVGSVAIHRVVRVLRSMWNDEKASKMRIETEDGEQVTITRNGEWPNGFDGHMLSKAGGD